MTRKIVPSAVALSMFLVVWGWTGAAAGSVSITCPAAQAVLATSGAGAVVLYPPPTVTSLCPGETVGCSPPAGSTFPVGTTVVTCTATAFLGDEATCNFTVHVKGASEQTTDLITQVRRYHLKAGIETSLVVKLQAVLNAVAAEETSTAVTDLHDFIDQVTALLGKKFLTASQGTALIAAANQIIVILTSSGATAAVASVVSDSRPFPDAYFRATHNSYEGGTRHGILTQLDAGVRFLELDVHDNAFGTYGYRIGHDEPGDRVSPADGNPATNLLTDWLTLIREWSWGHPQHAPMTLGLDAKDNLTDNHNASEGNMAALNEQLVAVFGEQLFRAEHFALSGWPTVDALRGRVIVVLSGTQRNRLLYLRDPGHNPAVAMNTCGRVVEVHDSGSGGLWYWTGQLQADGTVRWYRHGFYDTGITPAVALADDGTLVEVHQSENNDGLYYHVGFLSADNDIQWSPSHQFGNGTRPTVRFTAGSAPELTAIHRCMEGAAHCLASGTLHLGNPLDPRVDWTAAVVVTDLPLYERSHATAAGRNVSVFTGADAGFPDDTLLYGTDVVPRDRIRYTQIMFVEYQKDDASDQLLGDDLQFFGAPAGATDWADRQRRDGKVVRLWDFDDPDGIDGPPVNLPATNVPFAPWYVDYLTTLDAAE